MVANTGRTTPKWTKLQVEGVGGAMRDIPVSSINGIFGGEQIDITALRGSSPQHVEEGTMKITGPFDSSPLQKASGSGEHPSMSGSHTVLSGLVNENKPLSFAVYQGIRHPWETGEPVYGLSADANNGVVVTNYTVGPDGFYSATLHKYPGSANPVWGTSFDTPTYNTGYVVRSSEWNELVMRELIDNQCPYCATEDITPVPAIFDFMPDTCPNCGGWLE